jgi:hypothetical protein
MAEKRGGDFGPSAVASGDLSASQFRFVRFINNDVLIPTSGAQCLGVLQNKPRNREFAGVIGIGYTKLWAAQSMASGCEVMAGNLGTATIAASGQWTHGYFLGNVNSGDLGEAVVGPGYIKTV